MLRKGNTTDKQQRSCRSKGTTATLVKENTVHAGLHELQLKIYDAQGQSSSQNLSIIVCNCTVTPHCHLSRLTSTGMSIHGIGAVLAAFFVLLGVLVLLVLLRCVKEKAIPVEPCTESHLLDTPDIETPGTDCQVPNITQAKVGQANVRRSSVKQQHPKENMSSLKASTSRGGSVYLLRQGSSMYRGMSRNTSSHMSVYQRSMLSRRYTSSLGHAAVLENGYLSALLNRRLQSMQTAGEELLHYNPKIYAYDDDAVTDPHLDDISIPESDFSPDNLLELGPRFYKLASTSSLAKPSGSV